MALWPVGNGGKVRRGMLRACGLETVPVRAPTIRPPGSCLPARALLLPPPRPAEGGVACRRGSADPAFPPRGLITHRRRMQPRRRHSLWAPGGGGVPGLCSRAGPGGGGGSAARN